MLGLGQLDGRNTSARWVSGDGSSIMGSIGNGSGHDGDGVFRWTEEEGMEVVLQFERGSFDPVAFSADGRAVVGSYSLFESRIKGTFVWYEGVGAVDVSDLLIASGVEMSGWELITADTISNGSIIAGRGTNPEGRREAWIAEIPELPAPDVLDSIERNLLSARQIS